MQQTQPWPRPNFHCRKVFLATLLLAIFAGGVIAQQADQKPEPFVLELNVNGTADNLLRMARNMANDGAHNDAANLYIEAIRIGRHAVTEVEPGYFLPLWRVLIEDSSAWPDEARHELTRTMTLAEAGELEKARSSGDLLRLENGVKQYFLAETGASATVFLADRFREKGWHGLALFYYQLVLEKHPNPDIPRRHLLLRIALAAQAAGLNEIAAQAAAELDGAELDVEPGIGGKNLPEWLRKQPAQLPPHGRPSAGHGNVSRSTANPPAVVLWENDLAASASRYSNYLITLNTPVTYPALAGNVVYITSGHTIWAHNATDGQLLWKFDTRPTPPDKTPPMLHSQAMQPLIDDGVVYVPLQNEANSQRVSRPTSVPTDLYALDATEGKVLWKWNPRNANLEFGELNVDGRPLITGDVLVVSLNATSAYFGEMHLAGLSRDDGKLLWTLPLAGYTQGGLVTRPPGMNYGMTGQIISGSLATRGGIVFSNGLGATSAHSAASGTILWIRSMKGLIQAGGTRPSPSSGVKNNLADEMGLSRLPRLLISRNGLLVGSILAKNIESYHWLNGKLLWRQASANLRHPVAITADGHAVFWGSHVAVIDSNTGRPLWEPYQPQTPIIGEPVVTESQIILPLPRKIIALDLKTGKLLHETDLPQDISGGNLAASYGGLVLVTHKGAISFLDWQTACSRLLDQAEREKDNPHPLLTLGQAALRLRKETDAIGFLDRAIERPLDDQQRIMAYYLYEYAYRSNRGNDRDDYLRSLLDRMQKTSGPTNTVARHGLLRAEYFAARDPRQALAALQSVLDVDRSRDVAISGIAGPGISSVLAEDGIQRLIAAHGRQIYQPWEQRAAEAHRQALADNDYDALINLALQYPNSLVAHTALQDALRTAFKNNNFQEADRLLIRLCLATDNPDLQIQYRALHADASLKTGNGDFASFQIAALADLPVGDRLFENCDGNLKPIKELMEQIGPPSANTRQQPEPPPPLPQAPYRCAWKFDTGQHGVPNLSQFHDYRSPEKRENGTVMLCTDRKIITLKAETGEVISSVSISTNRAGSVHAFDESIYHAMGNQLIRLNYNGEKIWQITIKSTAAAAGDGIERRSLIGSICYGRGEVDTRNEQITHIREIGDYILAAGRQYIYLIDSRDGYIINSFGGGTLPNPFRTIFQREDRLVTLNIDMRNVIQSVQHWRIADGRKISDIKLQRQWRLLSCNQSHDRLLLIANQGQVNQIGLLDIEAGALKGWLKAAAYSANAHAIIGDTIILPIANDVIAAYRISDITPDVDKNAPLWTAKIASNRYFGNIAALGDQLAAIYSNNGITIIDVATGKTLWTLADQAGSMQHLQGDGERIAVMRNRRQANRFTRFASVLDSKTGKEVYRFDDDSTSYIRISTAPGCPGMFLLKSGREFEYWIHDPQGEPFDAEEAEKKAAEGEKDTTNSDQPIFGAAGDG